MILALPSYNLLPLFIILFFQTSFKNYINSFGMITKIKAAKIAKIAYKNGTTLKHEVIREGIISAKEYDVIIVGSGAGGGMATKILSEAGLSVAVVEAGPFFDPADPKSMTQLKPAFHSPRRGGSTTRHFGDYDQAYGGWDIDGEAYSQKDDTDFRWFRSSSYASVLVQSWLR